jgi:CheY-like chemotaxis protein
MPEGKKILIVDDDPAFLEINRMILESAGYQVDEAASVAQALQQIQANPYDLLVLDLIMETMDAGFTIAYAVRSEARTAGWPILLLTSAQERTGFTFHLDQDKDWMKVDDIAAKPLSRLQLLERVERLLGERGEDHDG